MLTLLHILLHLFSNTTYTDIIFYISVLFYIFVCNISSSYLECHLLEMGSSAPHTYTVPSHVRFQISLTPSLTDLIFLLFFFPLQNATCFINLSKTKSIVSNTFLCVYPPLSVCGQNQIFVQDLIPVRAPVAQFDTEQILGKCLLLLLRVS